MDNRSPKSREILGPRPPPLKIRKESHKIIKKPPLVPQPRLQPPEPAPPQLHQHEPPRDPVIIYTVSPKIIHTHPNNFMALVQRLTGKTSTSTTSSSSSQSILAPNNMSGTSDTSHSSISPAAKYAAMEKANASNEVGFVETTDQYHHHHHHHQNRAHVDISNFYNGGILSPNPNSLPLISQEFFSTVAPPNDPQGLSALFNDFNSILQTSPPKIPSPSMDHFNNFFDS